MLRLGAPRRLLTSRHGRSGAAVGGAEKDTRDARTAKREPSIIDYTREEYHSESQSEMVCLRVLEDFRF
jgi:hypothetical protein